MGDYQQLFVYIPYFEKEDTEFCNWDSGYPDYDEKLSEFIKTAYETDLLRKDYLEYLDERIMDHNLAAAAAIPTADLELLKALFTFYVRQERFNDGLWAKAAKDKVFLEILYRLRELMEDHG